MEEKCSEEGLKLHFPSPIFCTDNAAMIGVAAYFEYINNNFKDLTLNAVPNLEL
jgi:probable O-sialoglycoprotein endopeptidase